MRKRQEVVDSRLDAAAHENPDNVAIHAALKDFAELSSLNPEKGCRQWPEGTYFSADEGSEPPEAEGEGVWESGTR
ncbi:uncharacterized protein Z519_03132 [Cladophialophora bantiana CBS 173.52]|uniref:Uncharacterized protein n=1 Tax=Cladophialophora bantiana (strain ATCC 10958 / CBS 173.52 / CDC B-1940 / NIH 8579) TaxID=1442370 RepID=A0A0D2F1L4_CLAB1|nr:uncharacterized protein Z519_03132 [Cladophialophora bantiana CBS 173.52]KIW96066.1 hypothetical protein Z519_03132 [Cladophialophora bantiana CBS 173.52]